MNHWRVATLFLTIIALSPVEGCASEPGTIKHISIDENVVLSPPKEKPSPGPSNFEIDGTIEVEVPPPMVVETGLPGTLKGTIHIKTTSEPVNADRSRYEGHLNLVLTDGSGKMSLVNLNLNARGESDGTPWEGIAGMFMRFLDTAELMSRSISSAATQPSGK